MGININVPNQINQNTPLRPVRSGATAEPDYSVKYVPQDLTEAQQAQARENIGAGTSDFSGSYNDLIDKPNESLELTMTDEDGNVITGTFVLTSKTVTPAV